MTNPKESKSKLHIGMRKVKSLLAILIGFVIWQMIRLFIPDLEFHPLFIYMYGFLEIQNTSEKTKIIGIQRIKATFIALLLGLPLLYVRSVIHINMQSETYQGLVDLALILVGVLLALQLGERFGCGNLTGFAAAIFVVLLVYHSDDTRYLYAVVRASQTIIGVLVAWLLNVVLLPYPGRKNEETEETQ